MGGTRSRSQRTRSLKKGQGIRPEWKLKGQNQKARSGIKVRKKGKKSRSVLIVREYVFGVRSEIKIIK